MKLKHNIQLVRVSDTEIVEIDDEIDRIISEIDSTITTISDIGNQLDS